MHDTTIYSVRIDSDIARQFKAFCTQPGISHRLIIETCMKSTMEMEVRFDAAVKDLTQQITDLTAQLESDKVERCEFKEILDQVSSENL